MEDTANQYSVGMVNHLHLHRHSGCGISNQLHDTTRAHWQISGSKHHDLEYYLVLPLTLFQFPSSRRMPNAAWNIRSRVSAYLSHHERHVVQA
jgi:hypothetical protein